MALLSLFGVKPKEEVEMVPVMTENTTEQDAEDTKNSEEDKEEEEKKHLITITWGTGMPIDVIFHFIHKNYEEDGFQDALINSDITYRDAKERLIRYDLEMLFKRITLRYKNDIREIGIMIDNARKAYALESAAKMEARRETYEEHLEEIKDMQARLEAEDPTMTAMIESYRRGFQKGIASKTMSFIG